MQEAFGVLFEDHFPEESPLHQAVKAGKTYAAKVLIELGASVNNGVTDNCKTALHYAAQKGDFRTVEVLIEHGANVNAMNLQCETPLHYAAMGGDRKIAELLINNGAMVNAFQRYELTRPYHPSIR